MTLTAREEEFVKMYVMDFCSDAMKSYIRAFNIVIEDDEQKLIVVKELKKFMLRAEIKKAIDIERKKFVDNYKLTKEQIAYKIARIQRKTERDEDYNTSLKALDMLGKIVGAYQPEQQVNIMITQSDRNNINSYLFGGSEPKQLGKNVGGFIETKKESEE